MITVECGPLDAAAFARLAEMMRQLAEALAHAMRQLDKTSPESGCDRKQHVRQQVWPAVTLLQSRTFDVRAAIVARRRRSHR